MIKNRKAVIFGLSSFKLKKSEKVFLKKEKPWGIILFSRNIKSINQTQKLIISIKNLFKDNHYPILIDEEGGRVSRLNKFIDNSIFSQGFFGKLYKKDKKKFYVYYNTYIKQISYLLTFLGINLNTCPVLDVRRVFSDKIIGDRSYSFDPKIVSKLGDFCISKFHKNHIGTVIKHIPGHGLSRVDSHKKLPILNNNIKEFNRKDFKPFFNKKSLFAMTAHIVYNNIDKHNCATHSKKIIQLIRKKIGFKNLILSDDISMKALKFSLKENTARSFTAGCNLVLHCNGKLTEMIKVAKNSPIVDSFIIKKTSQFRNIIR